MYFFASGMHLRLHVRQSSAQESDGCKLTDLFFFVSLRSDLTTYEEVVDEIYNSVTDLGT